jgi:hypothetical protein
MATDKEAPSALQEAAEEPTGSPVLRAIGWVSVGITLAAISIFVGRELRSRYKFKRRTPYDFYDHVGESEYGVGV